MESDPLRGTGGCVCYSWQIDFVGIVETLAFDLNRESVGAAWAQPEE